jgi:hypothetical protein
MTNQLTRALVLNRGTDIKVDLIFKDDAGDPIDMTGHTIAVFEADAWGTANGSVDWTDQAAGEAQLSAAWGGDTPAETWFRVRTTQTSSGFDDALPKITVRFV